jgi:hypothetical protein
LESNLYFDPEPQKTHDKSSKEQIIIQIKEQIIIATKILSLSLSRKNCRSYHPKISSVQNKKPGTIPHIRKMKESD